MSEVVRLLKEKSEGLRKQASFIREFQNSVVEKVASELDVDVEQAAQLIKEATTQGTQEALSTSEAEDPNLVVKFASESLAEQMGIDVEDAKILIESVMKEAKE